MNVLIRGMGSLLLAASVALVAGCAAPEPAAAVGDAGASAPPASAAPAQAASNARPAPSTPTNASSGPRVPAKAAPPMSDPLPPERVPDAPSIGNTAAVDRSCHSDADCAVKDVGSCCGYQPACVNVASRPDPQAVQAQCAKSGMSSVCGFQEIQGCQCVKGQCQAGGSAIR